MSNDIILQPIINMFKQYLKPHLRIVINKSPYNKTDWEICAIDDHTAPKTYITEMVDELPNNERIKYLSHRINKAFDRYYAKKNIPDR